MDLGQLIVILFVTAKGLFCNAHITSVSTKYGTSLTNEFSAYSTDKCSSSQLCYDIQFIALIFHACFLLFFFFNEVVSATTNTQVQCFSSPGKCTGDSFETDTTEDCCLGSGFSYRSTDNGTCSECVGKWAGQASLAMQLCYVCMYTYARSFTDN